MSTPSVLTPEAKNVVSVFRALTVSRKHPYKIKDLMKEFKQVEGSTINLKRFGFDNLEDFLAASGEFTVNKVQGEVCVTAKPSKESAHIVKLVKSQKTPRKKPQNSLMRNPQSTDHSWNKSSYSSTVFQHLIEKSPKKNKSHGNGPRHTTGDNNNNNYPNKSNNQSKDAQNLQKQRSNSSNNLPDLRERLQAKGQLAASTGNKASRAILGQSNKQNRIQPKLVKSLSVEDSPKKSNQQTNAKDKEILSWRSNNQPARTNNEPTQQNITSLSKRLQRIKNHTSSQKQGGGVGGGSKVSIQNRLKITQQTQQNAEENNTTSSASKDLSSAVSNNKSVIIKQTEKKLDDKKNVQKSPSKEFEFKPTTNPITSLEHYCLVRRFAKPEYHFLKPKFLTRIQCRVLVNGVMYSTYPDDFATEAEAKLACARGAIEQIQIDEARNRYPVCMDSDYELALKIFQELKNHPHGVFCKNMPDVFQNTFQQTLPEHWFSVLQASSQFIIETIAGNNTIVFANAQATESSTTSSISDSEFITFDRIQLPWEQKYWNLYITYCASTVEVWARIVGKDYSDQLDSILTDVDLAMLTDKTRPTSITTGQIYLVSISECWHRVRVENMNKTSGKCLCFFIDFGDEDWLPMEQLYVCEPAFLRLPPQAIAFNLFGLEDFAENPNAKRHLDNMLIGKTLIGEILTKKETYESHNEADSRGINRIQVVLYDTSSNEDVNLNPLILTKISDDTPPPELKRGGVSDVNITYVNNHGEIFLQVKNVGLSYVQKLIHQLVDSKFKEEQHQVTLEDLKKSDSLFLIQDMDDLKWYRGALVSGEVGPHSNEYQIFYVDYGMVKATNISRIFRLESLSAALSNFPKQALRVKLHNLPSINPTIVARLRGLLPSESPAFVKIAVPAVVPHVIVYKRSEINDVLFNVNEVIQIEYELESSNDVYDNQSNGINDIKSQSPSILDKRETQNVSQSNVSSEMSSVIRNLSIKSPITVPASPQKGELPKLASNIWIPEIGEFFEVFVSMASNPSNFVVQPYNEGPKLSELMKELQEYCTNNDEFIPGDMIEVGQAYAALNTDGIYHRVTVENVFNSSMIHVCYCDFGDIAVLSNDKLKTLPAKFRTLPKQAVVAKLYGVKPKHRDWTLEDCMRFRKLTVGNRFVSIIKNISIDVLSNSKIIELQLVDVDTEDDIYIHEVLIEEGRAVADN